MDHIMLSKLDKELDEHYTRQIIQWLRRAADAEEEIQFWEEKRRKLREIK